MVGEIRDKETAGIAVNTALTGHLLLSTLHTNDAATTLPRLMDLGIEEYLVASTVSLIIGQRLVRKICQNCKEKTAATKIMKEKMAKTYFKKMPRADFYYRSKGCQSCDGKGFLGRISINEVLVADQKIKESILKKERAETIENLAKEGGMTDMLEDGFGKVFSGLTTFEEIFRIMHEN